MAYSILNTYPDRPIRGILFDMDGVILDSEKLYARFWRESLNSYGFPMTYEQALGMRSLNRDAGQAYLSSLFGPAVNIDTLKARRVELMDAYVKEYGIEAKPTAGILLDYLDKAGIPKAITTASPRDRIEDHLGRVGLLQRFDRICTAREVPHGKPEPDIYLHGAASLRLAAEDCMAIEDSYTGILSAVRAGCRAVIVPDLDQPGENILSIAWARADTLADVIGLLEAQKE